MTKETNQWEKLNLEKFIFSEINFNKLDNLNKKILITKMMIKIFEKN